jgi:quercetin dioxygenase-like cupin family protein
MAGGPRFQHLDDLPWQEVRRQKHGERVVSVHEKWPEFSDRYLTVYAKYDPGMIVQPHGHNSDHIVFVIEGDVMCGDVHCPAGTHIALDQGDTFGPFVAGPNGATMFEVMMGDPRSFPGDLEAYEKFLAEQGVEPLPNPPIDMPDWLEDTRN